MMKKRIYDDHYEDIINLPHHISTTRTQMSILDRAAQFSPFAALTGHNDAIQKAEREFEEYMKPQKELLPLGEMYEAGENIFID